MHSQLTRRVVSLMLGALLPLWLGCAATGMQTPSPQDPMGGMGLGGSAQTMLLAEARLDSLPAGPLAWIAYEAVAGGASPPHRHAPAFIYAVDGTHAVTRDRQTVRLTPGQASFVGQNVTHTHEGQGRFWEIRLAASGSPPPGDLRSAKSVFSTEALQGIPRAPLLTLFVLVTLPPGGETSVHTHPGPEFIVVTKGEIVYQNALIGTRTMRVGQWHAIPPDTAVQKRNPAKEAAAFLSLFLLDPNRPFTAPGQF